MLCWIDVETTGLNPYWGLDDDGDRLLQVACLMTDKDLNLLDEDGFEAVIRYGAKATSIMRALTPDIVREMHDKSGLWDMLPNGTPLPIVEDKLFAYISKFAPSPRMARLAGNSVRLDANFLDRFMSKVSSHLHYRMLDVSSLEYVATSWLNLPKFEKQKNHTAMEDIKESLAQARYIRSRLLRLEDDPCDPPF